jgi:hypothetical protein
VSLPIAISPQSAVRRHGPFAQARRSVEKHRPDQRGPWVWRPSYLHIIAMASTPGLVPSSVSLEVARRLGRSLLPSSLLLSHKSLNHLLVTQSIQRVKCVTEGNEMARRCNKAHGGCREAASPAASEAVRNFVAYRPIGNGSTRALKLKFAGCFP